MLCIKLLSLFVLILCLIPEQSQVSATFWPSKCFIKPCFNFERTKYASDDKSCLVLRNSCHLRNEICNRLRNNLPVLSVATKEACQAKCIQVCGTEKAPVCGEYAGVYKMFDNNCELLKTACDKGQSIIQVPSFICTMLG